MRCLLVCSLFAVVGCGYAPIENQNPPRVTPAAMVRLDQEPKVHTAEIPHVKPPEVRPVNPNLIVAQGCKVDPGDERLLVSSTDGVITSISVHEGQVLTEDAVVAMLDDRLVRAKKAEIEAAYTAAKTKADSDAGIVAVQAELDRARKNYERVRTLIDGTAGAITQAEYDEIYTQYLVAKAALEKAKADHSVDQQIVKVEIAKWHSVQVEIALHTIKCPIAGIVDTIHRRVGEYATKDRPLVTIRSLAEVTVEGYITEAEFQRLTRAADYQVRIYVLGLASEQGTSEVDSSIEFFEATIDHLPSELFQAGSTRQIRFRVKNRQRTDHPELGAYALVPGMRVQAEILCSPEANQLTATRVKKTP